MIKRIVVIGVLVLFLAGCKTVLFSEGAEIVKIDDTWSKVNDTWLSQRYKEERLLLKALEDCRIKK